MTNLNFCCHCEKSYRNENAFHYHYWGSHKKNVIRCQLCWNLFQYSMDLDRYVEAVHQPPAANNVNGEKEVVAVQEMVVDEEEAENSYDKVVVV
ncbi:hypothetical protein ACOSP7_024449 [Xanthoceras sorbifolium]